MPLPKPRPGEQQSAFTGRCIAFVKGENPATPNAQAAAMCYTAWRGRAEAMHPALTNLKDGELSDKQLAEAIEKYHKIKLARNRKQVSHLVEAIDFEGAEFVEENGVKVIKNVAMLGPQSSHGYEYTQDAMANAVGNQLYEGVRIFINHDASKQGRNPMELAGVFRGTQHSEGKVRGTAHLLPDEYGLKFWNIAKHMPEAASCSHVAEGRMVKSKTGDRVEEITKVHSVDLVVQGATTSTVFEGAGASQGEPKMDYNDVKLADLKTARPDIVRALNEEGATGRDDEVQAIVLEKQALTDDKAKLQLKVEELQTAETMRQKQAIVDKVVQELPEHARTDSIKALCMQVETGKDGFNEKLFEAKVAELIKPIKEACAKGGVQNMGGDKDTNNGTRKEGQVDDKAAEKALTLA